MMRFRTLAALGLVASLIPFAAGAEYPERAITIVAPYGAGGSSDLAARALSEAAERYMEEPLQVVNRTGAGGVTGANSVAKADPDGYELLLARVGSNGVTPAIDATIPYDYDDFTFLGLLEENPYVFVVHADSPYQSMDDLVEALQENPGTLTYSTSGPGTILNMGPQLLLREIGLEGTAATMIPYDGGGAARTALVGQHVDFLGINLAPVLDDIQDGTLRALAVTTRERYEQIPDVPTVSEVGFPELHNVIGWSALFGPPGLPGEVVATWTDLLQSVSGDERWRETTRNLGSVPRIEAPEVTAEFMHQQHRFYRELGEELDLRIE